MNLGDGTSNMSSPNADAFVSKLDSSGGFLWVKQFDSNIDAAGSSVAVDASGKVYTSGYFSDTADFDPSVSVKNLTSMGSSDIF